MIKRDTIQRYGYLPIRKESHYIIQSWDTAIKVDANNDCSVCATLQVDERRNYYVVEVLRDRLLYPELKAHAISQAKKHRPNIILIEEAGRNAAMRAFLAAVVVSIILAAVGGLVLAKIQEPASVAYSTEAVRL